MRPLQIAQAIHVCMKINRPMFIWGPPGVGKSDSVKQAGAAAGLEVCDFRAALRDAVDIMGLPGARIDADGVGSTYYNLPAGLPRGGSGILFLDEMNSAPAQTQAALYQLVLDRRVGDYVLPPGWRIVAAGNRQTDRGVVHRMPDPLVDRFFHVDYEVHLDDWCAWAVNRSRPLITPVWDAAEVAASEVRPEVVAFIRFRPGLLHSHDTTRQCHAFATPRGWADVSLVLGLNTAVEAELIRGRVGDGAASEFMAFLKLYRNMISPDEILRAPRKAAVPDNVGTLYALAEALARRATAENIGAVLVYAKRIPAEYAQALVSSMTRITPELCNTHEYIAWSSSTGA